MKKETYVLAGVFLAIVIATSFVAYSRSLSSEESEAFSIDQIQAAASLKVSMPPVPEKPTTTARIVGSSIQDTVRDIVRTIAAGNTSDICAGKDLQNFECYQEHYESFFKGKKADKAIPEAFADLKVRYETNPYVKSQCHPLSHVIGRMAAQSYDQVTDAYVHGDNFCWSGYFHGVLETYAARVGLENLQKNINTVCTSLNAEKKYGLLYFNCVHGLGHGLMAITDDELFDSLNYCDALVGDWEQQSCAGGVYMENVIADGINHSAKYLDPGKPFYPCSESPEKYKNSCFLLQTSYMLKISNSDWHQTFAWCRQTARFQATCLQSVGRDASGRTASDGPQTKALCEIGTNEFEKVNCIIGAVKDFISYFHSDKQAAKFCDLYTDASLHKTCTGTATEYYAQNI